MYYINVPDVTYSVLGKTLNLAQSINHVFLRFLLFLGKIRYAYFLRISMKLCMLVCVTVAIKTVLSGAPASYANRLLHTLPASVHHSTD